MIKENLWKKRALLFMLSQGITLLGSSIVQMAIIWYVTVETSSGIWLTILTLSSFLPQMIISFFAGVWADKYNKKKIIILSDLLIAVTTLILAIFLFKYNLGNVTLGVIVFLSIVRSIGTGIQTPTVNSMIPQLVPEENLIKYNGINSSLQSIIQFASPLIAGAILMFSSISSVLLLDVITAIIGVGILSFIKIEKSVTQNVEEKVSMIKEIKEGIHFAISNKSIGNTFLIYALFIFLSVPSSFMTTLIITRNFGEDYLYLSISEAIGFIGMFLGGLLLGIWGGFANRNKTLSIGIMLFGIFAVLIGISTQFWIFVVFIFFISFSIPIIQTTTITILQEKTKEEMQGRVFGLLNAIFSGFMPLGMILFGILSDITHMSYLIVPTGILLIFVGALVLFSKMNHSEIIQNE